MKHLIFTLLLAVSSLVGADTFSPGQVLTASSLNSALSAKTSVTDLAATGSGKGSDLVGFKRTGTGTVSRTVADKLADIVHAKDYGVKCDNSADDTTAINTMLTAAAGKTILLPAGNCKYAGGGTLTAGTVLVGAGRNATFIRATQSAATLFSVSGYGAGIKSLAFYANVTQTGGSYVVLSGSESFIEDFYMTGDYNGILMTGNVARIRHGRFQNGAAGAIRIRAEGGDNSQLIDDVLMGAQSPQVAAAGIRVRNSSALIISNTSIINQGHALLIDPYTSTQGAATDAGGVYSLWVHHAFLDNSSGDGIRIAVTGTGSVVRVRFDNVWASSSSGNGVFINNAGSGVVSGIHFTSPHLVLNGGSGLTTGGTVSDVSVIGGEVAQNLHGVYFNTGLTGAHVSGVTIGAGAGLTGNSQNGVVIASGVDYVILANNDVRGNGLAALSNSGGSNMRIQNNLGVDSTSVSINGGTINGTPIGGTTRAAGDFSVGSYSTRFGVGTANNATAAITLSVNAGGPTSGYGVRGVQSIQSALTSQYVGYSSAPSTQATVFTLGDLQHFRADSATVGAGSAVTLQTGFIASDLTSAGTNYGFRGLVSAGSNNYNIYMDGTAKNYMAGALGLGGQISAAKLAIAGNATGGGTSMFGIRANQAVQSDVTSLYATYNSIPSTQATTFTLNNLQHFRADGPTIGAGSTVVNQVGYYVSSTVNSATTNYGFQSALAAASGVWGFYGGTANNSFAGSTSFGSNAVPTSTVDVTGTVSATSSILSSGATAGIGYKTGAGGAVTQATSKTTGVTLNTVTGQITMNNAALAAGATACFVMTNSAVAANDAMFAVVANGATAGAYTLQVDAMSAGSARMCLNNRSAGSLSEAVVLNFVVLKGASS